VAISALVAAEEGERANLVLPRMLSVSGLDERDRGFATELAYGALRMCRACDWLIGQFAKGELEPAVRAAARAGAYQLAFMRVPAYAAVSATVAECPPRARPLLNAVLRRVADLVAAGPVRWPDPGTRLSYPDWMLARLGEDLGAARALAALEQMNQAASPSTRPDGYIQDAGSQAVGEYLASLLAGRSGPVLDLCAAPGGKTTFLAHGSAFVVGVDVAPARARLVAGNAGRLQLPNVAVVVADGTQPPFRPETFAGALVDAPCSGLGVLRRRPDARWRARPEDVGRLASLQRRLLSAAAPLVAPGGVLVYSVCTLTRKETVDIDEWLAGGRDAGGDGGPGGDGGLSGTGMPGGRDAGADGGLSGARRLGGTGRLGGDWEPAPPPGPPWEPLGRGALLLPQAAGTDGMYVLALCRR
jgi:16S rRNA (cytosine967-C5)-methyltransferase